MFEMLIHRLNIIHNQQYEWQIKFESPNEKHLKKPLLMGLVNHFQDNHLERYVNTIDKNVVETQIKNNLPRVVKIDDSCH